MGRGVPILFLKSVCNPQNNRSSSPMPTKYIQQLLKKNIRFLKIYKPDRIVLIDVPIYIPKMPRKLVRQNLPLWFLLKKGLLLYVLFFPLSLISICTQQMLGWLAYTFLWHHNDYLLVLCTEVNVKDKLHSFARSSAFFHLSALSTPGLIP